MSPSHLVFPEYADGWCVPEIPSESAALRTVSRAQIQLAAKGRLPATPCPKGRDHAECRR